MKVKAIVFDMDGTLLSSSKKLPSDFPQAVDKMVKLGIQPIIASGRHKASLDHNLGPMKDHFVYLSDNGACVYQEGTLDFMETMDDRTTLDLVNALIPLGYPLYCTLEHGGYVLKDVDPVHVAEMRQYIPYFKLVDSFQDLRNILKISLYDPDFAFERLDQIETLSQGFAVIRSGQEWVDIMRKDVSKGHSLARWFEKHQVDPKQAVVFGDAMNDYEMMKLVPFSVAMGNADPRIKAIASVVTDSNDQDGVMKVLWPLLERQGLLDV